MVLCLFLIACPSKQEIDLTVSNGISTLQSRAIYYAYICYRPNASLTEGAHAADLEAYYQEILSEIESVNASYSSKEELLTLEKTLRSLDEKYSMESILDCAKRNFSYLSEDKKKWFEIFDKYGEGEFGSFQEFQEAINTPHKEIDPLLSALFERQLIIIGNTHPEIEHGKILYELTEFFKNTRYRVGSLFTEHLIGDNFSKTLSETRAKLLDGRLHFRQDKTPHDISEGVLQDALLRSSKGDLVLFKQNYILEYPRMYHHLKYQISYPNIPVLAIDRRKKDKSDLFDMASADQTIIKESFKNSDDDDKWLMYYGTGHVLRHASQTTDTTDIEKNLNRDAFVIDQQGMTSTNNLITKIYEAGFPKIARDGILSSKFNFPNVPLLKNPTYPLERAFTWVRLIQQYQAFKIQNQKHRYINLVKADKDGALSFNDNIPPVDLLIIGPSELSGPFDYDKDSAYQTLKNLLNK